MTDANREQMQALLRSPEWRDRFVDQALSDDPPQWIGNLSRVFRSWFVNRLDQELILAVVEGMPESEALARAARITRLAERWGVTGLPPDVERAGYQVLAGLAERSRVDDASAEPPDASDPASLVLWVAEVQCARCGLPLARAAARRFKLVADADGNTMHADLASVDYLPDPERRARSLVWHCRRCDGDRLVSEQRALSIIRDRWLKRSRSLGLSPQPAARVVIKAGAP